MVTFGNVNKRAANLITENKNSVTFSTINYLEGLQKYWELLLAGSGVII